MRYRHAVEFFAGLVVGICACALTAAIFMAASGWLVGVSRIAFTLGALGGTIGIGVAANVWAVMSDMRLSRILGSAALATALVVTCGAALGFDIREPLAAWRDFAPGCLAAGIVCGGMLGGLAGLVLGAVYRYDTEWWVESWPAS